MRAFKILSFIAGLLMLNNCAESGLEDGLYAILETSRGRITVRLEYEKAPLTVANFIALAEGTMQTSVKEGRYFDNMIFHRVLDHFIIQSGCPLGNGTGGPGYVFPNEIHPDLRHDSPGVVGMANSGPHTNGSQFYITLAPAPHLDGGYTVFGRVVAGMSVVASIKQEDKLNKVTIKRVGSRAQHFRTDQESMLRYLEETWEKIRIEDLKTIRNNWPDSEVDDSGLMYIITQRGKGTETPGPYSEVTVHYTGSLLSGEVFDDSKEREEPAVFRLNQVIQGWQIGLAMMKKGEKRVLIIPPELAYGAEGYQGIPPNSFLVFEVELLDFKE